MYASVALSLHRLPARIRGPRECVGCRPRRHPRGSARRADRARRRRRAGAGGGGDRCWAGLRTWAMAAWAWTPGWRPTCAANTTPPRWIGWGAGGPPPPPPPSPIPLPAEVPGDGLGGPGHPAAAARAARAAGLGRRPP